jgi:hypothetical protein
MSDLEQCYQQILSRPEEDALRRQYAEALPSGHPRAQFIVQQLELAALCRGQQRNARRVALTESTKALLATHGERWAQPLLGFTSKRRFSRGFVQHVELDAATLNKRLEDLFSSTPVLSVSLRSAKVGETAGILPELVKRFAFSRLLGLDLDNQRIGDEGLAALLASPHVRKLRYLSLNNNGLSERGIELLYTTPNLPELQFVALARNSAPDPIMSPAGQDWGSSGALDADWTDYGRALEAKHGRRPWVRWMVDRHTFDTPLPDDLIGGK